MNSSPPESGLVGVVADDTTGAGDIGISFARSGLRVVVLSHDLPEPLPGKVDVMVLDTDSRLDSPRCASEKVSVATTRLLSLGARPLFKKTCSVLRGPVGAEFDAMLLAAKSDFMVVSAVYPRQGRATRHGHHFVHGVPLSESAFARDPAHPMRESNLLRVLAAQTERPVHNVPIETVRRGPTALRGELHHLMSVGGYALVDGESQEDVRTLAEAAFDFPLFGGSAALAEELPLRWPSFRNPASPQFRSSGPSSAPSAVLIVAGSLTPQTREQALDFSRRGGFRAILDASSVFEPEARAREVARVAQSCLPHLHHGSDVLVQADPTDDGVTAAKQMAAQLGLSPLATNKAVSAALAEVAHHLLEKSGVRRLVVAGGDTSGTVCRRLGVTGYHILEEIEAGLPVGRAVGRELVMVLKSGSFGSAEFLSKAAECLRLIAP